MKIACMGDVHLTKKRPSNRRDDYWQTAMDKLEFVFEKASEEKAEMIIFPGDLTDTPEISYWEAGEIIDMFNYYGDIVKLTTYGQHDMRYRTKPNTALAMLEKAIPSLQIIENYSSPVECCKYPVAISGASYNEDPGEPMEGCFNILIIHRMIIEKKLWNAQEEYEPSNLFLRQHNFDLIVSGDNHQGFIEEGRNKKLLINCGSMLRSNIGQVEHKPFFVLFDTDTREYQKIDIPIRPAEQVFLLDKVAFEKETNNNLDLFVSGLSEQKEVGLVFKENIDQYCKDNEVEDLVVKDINEAFQNAKAK